jgi:alkylation response protein AidB-like acyl-CoA dehydrogenase
VLSTAAVAPGADADGAFSCVVVDGDRPGVEWLDGWHGFGMRANDSRTMRLAGVEVPHEALLGAQGDQLWYVFEVIAPYFLMAMAGTYLGVAQAAFDAARLHTGTRRYGHSGELLGQAPVVAHRLGSSGRRWRRPGSSIYSAAAKGDAGSAGRAGRRSSPARPWRRHGRARRQRGDDAVRRQRLPERQPPHPHPPRRARAATCMAPTTDIAQDLGSVARC